MCDSIKYPNVLNGISHIKQNVVLDSTCHTAVIGTKLVEDVVIFFIFTVSTARL